MNTLDIIHELSNTNSLKEKELILEKAWHSGNREFFIGANLAYNSFITFGIKSIAKLVEDDGYGDDIPFSEFLALTNNLQTRTLTGNAAKNAVNSLAEKCSYSKWNNFYRRVLLKDLNIGLQDKTINKVLKKISKTNKEAENYIIPVFSCQLAHSAQKHDKKLVGQKMVQYKLDGVRLLTIIDKENNSIKQFTRNGKEIVNFTNIISSLEKIKEDIPISVVLDGEIISESFQELMTQVNRKENIDTEDSKLALFDIIPFDDFQKGICSIPQKERHKELINFIPLLHSKNIFDIFVVPVLHLDFDIPEDLNRLETFYKDVLNSGYEGIMIKDPEAPYETKRSSAWLKVKPDITVDLKIVSLEEGTGKYTNNLGAFVCEGYDDDKFIRVNVGSGISDELRAQVWANHTQKNIEYMEIDKKTKNEIIKVAKPDKTTIIGKTIEIKCDCITNSISGGDTYSLRFPRFVRFRDDKN